MSDAVATVLENDARASTIPGLPRIRVGAEQSIGADEQRIREEIRKITDELERHRPSGVERNH
jgi:hypothetical protein